MPRTSTRAKHQKDPNAGFALKDQTLHSALADQGIATRESKTVNKRNLYLRSTCRNLGDWSASEAWEGLNSGQLIYRTATITRTN